MRITIQTKISIGIAVVLVSWIKGIKSIRTSQEDLYIAGLFPITDVLIGTGDKRGRGYSEYCSVFS